MVNLLRLIRCIVQELPHMTKKQSTVDPPRKNVKMANIIQQMKHQQESVKSVATPREKVFGNQKIITESESSWMQPPDALDKRLGEPSQILGFDIE